MGLPVGMPQLSPGWNSAQTKMCWPRESTIKRFKTWNQPSKKSDTCYTLPWKITITIYISYCNLYNYIYTHIIYSINIYIIIYISPYLIGKSLLCHGFLVLFQPDIPSPPWSGAAATAGASQSKSKRSTCGGLVVDDWIHWIIHWLIHGACRWITYS